MTIYNLLVRAYGFIIKLSSFRNKKARQWVSGRKDWRQRLKTDLANIGEGERLWVHCASYGEFEQGRTLMEAIRKNHPRYRIVLSFFSPSGYEAFYQWPGADVVCYLPLDTKKNAVDFIGIVRPGAVIFIKYEFWLNFLFELNKKAIPTYLVSAVFKDHHPFFKWYGRIFRRSLLTFKKLFIQDDNSGRLLQGIGISNYEVCGDTRFDRVIEIRENFRPLPFFEEFCAGHTILVAGSTWPGDEELLIAAFLQLSDPNLKLIIAPHHVDEKSIAGLVQLLEKNKLPFLLYSDQNQDLSKQIVIVDSIGLLSKIYYYATVAYVGGGFDSGIHNCLEPAVYLKPVLFFGDDFEKYNEAVELVKLKAIKNVMDPTQLEIGFLNFVNNWTERIEIENTLKTYFEKNSGVTKKVLDSINLG
ncbi:MAG: glycosyltransferase N-terminal domain-containing protein [Bacteroidota bacterium]